jgi:hypothetical protein
MVSCPECSNLIDGRKISEPQRIIRDMLGGELNYREGSYSIDIALIGDDAKIAIEYDAWFWHARKQIGDKRRDVFLENKGWKILRIKSNKKIPSKIAIEEHLTILRDGAASTEIVLDDWGVGRVWTNNENS